jgi:membrane-bound serine protease (ClpP class)
MGRLGLTVAVATAVAGMAFAIAVVAVPVAVLWVTGTVLLVLLAVTAVLAAHAGGHAWFLPLPTAALATAWAFTASNHSSVAGWTLVALSATVSAAALALAGAALRQRLRDELAVMPPLKGALGVALTELTPGGVVQVGGENWSAESVSGTLPAGAPIHALEVRGVHLEVWSEVGAVPDRNVLDIKEDQP